MTDFNRLTPIGKTRRLRVLARSAIDLYDLTPARLQLLKHSWNTMFRVDAAGGQRYVLCISKPGVRDELAIESELTWMDALARETDIVVPAPVMTRDGRLVSSVGVHGVPETRYVSVFHWIGGRRATHAATERVISHLGETMARLHDHAEQFAPPDRFTTKRVDRIGTFAASPVLRWTEPHPLIDGRRLALFQREAERVQAELDRMYGGLAPPLFLHLDLHLGNIKLLGNRIAVLDFDDSMWAYPTQDIAVTLYYLRYLRGFPESLRAVFQRGYARVRGWPEEWDGQMDLLLEARALDLLDVLVDDERSLAQQRLPELLQGIENQLHELSARRR